MNNKFKSYARSYWSDNFLWYVVKFKNYTEREILKNCHLLKLLREYLSKTYNSKLRRKYLDFCDLKENIESFEYIESGKLEFFMSCEALNNNLTVIQEGGGSATERQSMLDKFNNGYSYSKLIEKYEKKKLDDLGANFRNFINWFDDWGYAVRKNIGKKKFLYITEIGNDAADNYNNPAVALSIFRDQIKKYQFPNTSKKQLSLFKKESIKPYYAIVQIALDLPKNYFTKNEYIIFINKTKNHKIESIKKTVEWIKDYRKLSLRDRNKFINYLKFRDPKQRKRGKTGSSFEKTRESSEKSLQAFVENSGDLFRAIKSTRGESKYEIYPKKIEVAKKIINDFEQNPVKQCHEFINVYEYNLAIGRRNYNNIDEILKRNYFSINKKIDEVANRYKGISKQEIGEKEKRNLQEILIQKYYQEHIEILNKKFDLKLEIIKRKGARNRQTLEYNTFDVGEIDLLCKDRVSNDYYVIEIKRDEAEGDTLGQILQYMGWTNSNLCEGESEQKTKGIIICKKSSDKYRYARDYINNYFGNLDKCIYLHFHNFSDTNLPPAT